MMTMIGRW